MSIGIGGVIAGAAGFALSPMAGAVQALYGMGSAVNDFLDNHIAQMKQSENVTIAKTGTVLEMAKFGFGLGYMTSVAIIATGQLMLGNQGLAATTVATAATLTNPIAMTCAAFGAIYYGWSALSEAERDAILEKLRIGLEIGIETIKSIIAFIVKRTNEIFSPEHIAEFKTYVKTYAEKFGKSLSDITRKMVDRLKDTADKTAKKSNEIYLSTANVVSDTLANTGQVASTAAAATSSVAKTALASTGAALDSTSTKLKSGLEKAADLAATAAGSASTKAKHLIEKTSDAAQQLKAPKHARGAPKESTKLGK